MSARARRDITRRVISRDTLSFLGGWYLIIYEAQFAREFNPQAFAVGVLFVVAPGALAVWAGRVVRIGQQSSPSVQEAPSEPSSS